MPLWWTRLSLITSAKYVKFTLQASYFACLAHIILLMLVIWALLISPLPLVSTLFFIIFLLSAGYQFDLLPPCVSGDVTLHKDGRCQWLEETFIIEKVSLQFSFMVLILYSECGQRYLLWRDTCSDELYRQLLVRLAQINKQQKEP